jgi:hypothetical protein
MLRTARSGLATWRSRIEALLRQIDELEEGPRESIAPLEQSMRDRFRTIEIAVVKMERLEAAWRGVGVDIRNNFRELESAYELVSSSIDSGHRSGASSVSEPTPSRNSGRAGA